MKNTLLVLCFVGTLLLTGCTQSAPTNPPTPVAGPSPVATTKAATPDPLAAARGNYAKDCVACHGETGEGGLVKVEDKRLKVPSFKAEHARKHSDDEFVKQITKGGDGMPSFKDKLKPEEMQDLVKLIRSEFQAK